MPAHARMRAATVGRQAALLFYRWTSRDPAMLKTVKAGDTIKFAPR
jgi:hypothetical protein